jgi:hypothetical protein
MQSSVYASGRVGTFVYRPSGSTLRLQPHSFAQRNSPLGILGLAVAHLQPAITTIASRLKMNVRPAQAGCLALDKPAVLETG